MKITDLFKGKKKEPKIYSDELIELRLAEIVESKVLPKHARVYQSSMLNKDALFKINLSNHTRDTEWLVAMITKKLGKEKENIPQEKIHKFVTSSESFAKIRDAYENDSVEWLIKWTLGTSDDEFYRDDFFGFFSVSKDIDKNFIKAICDELRKHNFSEEAIERGLIIHHDLWLDKVISRAFDNNFYPYIASTGRKQVKFMPTEEEHEHLWEFIRKYEFFQQHMDAVKKYIPNEAWARYDYAKDSDGIKYVYQLLEVHNNKRNDYLKYILNPRSSYSTEEDDQPNN